MAFHPRLLLLFLAYHVVGNYAATHVALPSGKTDKMSIRSVSHFDRKFLRGLHGTDGKSMDMAPLWQSGWETFTFTLVPGQTKIYFIKNDHHGKYMRAGKAVVRHSGAEHVRYYACMSDDQDEASQWKIYQEGDVYGFQNVKHGKWLRGDQHGKVNEMADELDRWEKWYIGSIPFPLTGASIQASNHYWRSFLSANMGGVDAYMREDRIHSGAWDFELVPGKQDIYYIRNNFEADAYLKGEASGNVELSSAKSEESSWEVFKDGLRFGLRNVKHNKWLRSSDEGEIGLSDVFDGWEKWWIGDIPIATQSVEIIHKVHNNGLEFLVGKCGGAAGAQDQVVLHYFSNRGDSSTWTLEADPNPNKYNVYYIKNDACGWYLSGKKTKDPDEGDHWDVVMEPLDRSEEEWEVFWVYNDVGFRNVHTGHWLRADDYGLNDAAKESRVNLGSEFKGWERWIISKPTYQKP